MKARTKKDANDRDCDQPRQNEVRHIAARPEVRRRLADRAVVFSLRVGLEFLRLSFPPELVLHGVRFRVRVQRVVGKDIIAHDSPLSLFDELRR
jgi:hypothetical protein